MLQRHALGFLALSVMATACGDPLSRESRSSGPSHDQQEPAASAVQAKLLSAPAPPAPPVRFVITRRDAAPGIQRPVDARVIVKLRPGLDATLVKNVRPAGTVDITAAATSDPRVGGLLARHRVLTARAVFPERVRQRLARGLTDVQVADRTRRHNPTRSARATGDPAPDLSGLYRLDLGKRWRGEIDMAVIALRSEPDVLYAEEDRLRQATFVPNDPFYATPDDLWGLKRIGTTAAWDSSRGEGVLVAVVDTGIDYNHPDIDANVWTNPGEIAGNGSTTTATASSTTSADGTSSAHTRTPTPDNDPTTVTATARTWRAPIAARGQQRSGRRRRGLAGPGDGAQGPRRPAAGAPIRTWRPRSSTRPTTAPTSSTRAGAARRVRSCSPTRSTTPTRRAWCSSPPPATRQRRALLLAGRRARAPSPSRR